MAIGIMINGGKDNKEVAGDKGEIVVEKDEIDTNNEKTTDSTEESRNEQTGDNSTELDEENITPRNDQDVTTEPNTGNTGSNSGSTTKPSTGSTNNSGNTGNTQNNNTSTTQPSTPVHEHKWTEVRETVVVQEAWVEDVYGWRTICGKCGLDMTEMKTDDKVVHSSSICQSRYSAKYIKYDEINHPAVTEEQVTGYKCECGAEKK